MNFGEKQKKTTLKKPAKNGLNPGIGVTTDSRNEIASKLGQLMSANLYKLLQLKKVLGRSKYKTKAAQIKVLSGLVSLEELVSFLPEMPRSRNETITQGGSIDNRSQVIALLNSGEGRRQERPVLGLDVHKSQITYAAASPDGIVAEGIVENTPDGIQTLISLYRNLGACIAAMESTAEYWVAPFWQLQEAGF